MALELGDGSGWADFAGIPPAQCHKSMHCHVTTMPCFHIVTTKLQPDMQHLERCPRLACAFSDAGHVRPLHPDGTGRSVNATYFVHRNLFLALCCGADGTFGHLQPQWAMHNHCAPKLNSCSRPWVVDSSRQNQSCVHETMQDGRG